MILTLLFYYVFRGFPMFICKYRNGNGWGYEKQKHCVRSAYLFSEEDIVSATQRQLTWPHQSSPVLYKVPRQVIVV